MGAPEGLVPVQNLRNATPSRAQSRARATNSRLGVNAPSERDTRYTLGTTEVLRAFRKIRARAQRVELDVPMERVARLAGVSVRTVERAVRRLVADGLLVRTYLPGPRDRVDRKHSKWLVPYAPTLRGPEEWPVVGRMHGPWLPNERPVWARYAPKRKPRAESPSQRRNRAEPEGLSSLASTDKLSTQSFPSGTGGGDPPSPPPEPPDDSARVRSLVVESLKSEAGGEPPATPPLYDRATGRGARPPNPGKASREASADRPASEWQRAAREAEERRADAARSKLAGHMSRAFAFVVSKRGDT